MFSVPSSILKLDQKPSKKLFHLFRWLALRFSLSVYGQYRLYIGSGSEKISFLLRNKDIQIILYSLGINKEPLLSALLKHCHPDDLFIDIGANVGFYSIMLAATNQCRSIALEPVKSTYRQLLLNQSCNPDLDIQALRLACSDTVGRMTITSDCNGSNHLVTEGSTKLNTETVSVATLDQIFDFIAPLKAYSRIIVKIDVERHELNVLKGAHRFLSSAIPIILAVEYYSEAQALEMIDFLSQYDFCVCHFVQRHLEKIAPELALKQEYGLNLVFSNSLSQ
jgi:FkbM family methyltransferase